MQTQFLSLFPMALLIAFTGLMAASCAYFGLRAFEKWNRDLAVFFNVSALLAVLILLWAYASFLALYLLIPVMIAAFCGFTFHQKSGGTSESSGLAILFMMTVAFMTVGIQICLWLSLNRWVPIVALSMGSFSYDLGYFFYFLYYLPIPLVPFVLWLYQTSRPRPGIDRHLDADESEPPTPAE